MNKIVVEELEERLETAEVPLRSCKIILVE
ncbi:hypothetical protein SAMN05421544_12612 [Riemerella columbipharyngis]|uniref:Uncharacterized protein n=1 Tax=Riemerella columbipharyngis TaxID=1071918 RepID=A0A1G7FRC1_9FLAO|nr:hypothetical protein SAMN05421544_12612 [Riemerella columbipharyngis]